MNWAKRRESEVEKLHFGGHSIFIFLLSWILKQHWEVRILHLCTVWGTESLGKLSKVTQVLSGGTTWFELKTGHKGWILEYPVIPEYGHTDMRGKASQLGETASAQTKKLKDAWAIWLLQSDWNIRYVCVFPKNRLWAEKLCLSDFFCKGKTSQERNKAN